MTQKQNYIFLFLILLFVLFRTSSTIAQNTFQELEKLPIFSIKNDIVNGEMWMYQKKYEGHPFWKEDIWYKGYVVYKSEKFDSLTMRYDIHTNNLVVLKKELNKTSAYNLNKKYLERFALYNSFSTDTTLFYFITLDSGLNKAIYAKSYDGNCKYYIQYQKSVNNRVSDKYTGEYIFTPVLYAEIDNEVIEFRSKSEFLKLFGNNTTNIKKYMREQRIKFKKQSPENLSSVFQYYDSLTNSSLNN